VEKNENKNFLLRCIIYRRWDWVQALWWFEICAPRPVGQGGRDLSLG
jgi:hypothetical protein